MTQSSMIWSGSVKTGSTSYSLSLIPTEYESDSSVGLNTKSLCRMLIVGRIPNGKTTCGILAAWDMVSRKWLKEYLEMSKRLNHLVNRIRDYFINEVWDCTTDEFGDCIYDEALNYIAEEANDDIKDQIMCTLCDIQSLIQDKMRYELLRQYLKALLEAMCEYINSSRENVEEINHDAHMCPTRSLRNRNRRGIRIARNISTKRLSGDVFRRLFNLICRWTSCISMKWEWLTHTGLSLEVQRRYRSCVADSFRIGMQWQDVWKTPAPTLCVP